MAEDGYEYFFGLADFAKLDRAIKNGRVVEYGRPHGIMFGDYLLEKPK